MIKNVLLPCFVMMTIGLILAIGSPEIQSETGIVKTAETADNSLPVSLSNFYPPKVDQPVYLFQMLGLAEPFAGIVVDLFEDDYENLDANFEAFRARYIEVSNMIPEWKTHYPMEPIDELKTAIATRDKDKVMAAFHELNRVVCENCHLSRMSQVQFAYRWPRFQEITMMDPLTKGAIRFQQMKQFLETNFTGIGLDLKQGQVDNARGQFQAFRTRFALLAETCQNCHDTERHYYTDTGIMRTIDKLDGALNASSVDPQEVGRLLREIGTESCLKCHLVHGPAGLAQLEGAE